MKLKTVTLIAAIVLTLYALFMMYNFINFIASGADIKYLLKSAIGLFSEIMLPIFFFTLYKNLNKQ